MQTFELGIGDLVQLVLRSGDLRIRRNNAPSRLQEGARIHREIQEKDSHEKEDYKSEVYFKESYEYKDNNFILTGRADAIYKENDRYVIEEIKTTTKSKKDFEYEEMHLAQLCFYGFFFMLQNKLSSIDLKLHYYHVGTNESTFFLKKYTFTELEEYIQSILDQWLELGLLRNDWIDIRDNSIHDLEFIYDDFRKGQREMSLAVFNTIKRKDKALIEAPTGIGKTVASLFPAIKSLTKLSDHQIYYLTAKTTIQLEAKKALQKMRQNGLKIKSLTLTAKDKICFNKDCVKNCDPDECIYARNYFDKVKKVLPDSIKSNEDFDRSYIEKICYENEICPYHFSLELCNWADVIICDYNYAFDPVSKLENLNQKRITLVDEAHNLPDRTREMFSSELNEITFSKLYQVLTDTTKKVKLKGSTQLKKESQKISDFLYALRKELVPEKGDSVEISQDLYDEVLNKLVAFQNAASIYFYRIQEKEIEPDFEILEAYNDCSKEVYNFFVISEFCTRYFEKYKLYLNHTDTGLKFRIICLDASDFVNSQLNNNPTILFSATLTPFDYYKKVLLNEEGLPSIALPSPFKRNHYEVFCDDSISTRYSDRQFTNKKVAQDIYEFINAKKGHYLVFFPSYKYLEEVLKEFVTMIDDSIEYIIQEKDMSDKEREEFIEKFKSDNEKWLVGFCVMGGVFSEGIDLPLDALIGTVIIGPGLPGLSYERDLIKDYYEQELGDGYAYAYAYPGMNRVLQSAGRVIRTEEDKGLILLIDDRFNKPFYKRMIPTHLQPDYLNDPNQLSFRVKQFWRNHQETE